MGFRLRATLHALVGAYPLATWVLPHRGELLVNPIPFLLDAQRGEHGTLIGHLARANPVWQAVDDPTQAHETRQTHPWQVSDAPADYLNSLLKAIVGIEIPVQRWVGKWKVSQNRPAADQQGVAAGLMAQGSEAAAQMAALVSMASV